MNSTCADSHSKIILLIDGHCQLCNGIARFVIQRDSAGRFRFASIQSQTGQRLLARGGLPNDIDTFVMIKDCQYYTKSEAALRVLREMGRLWPLLYSFIVFPAFIRDKVYDFIARNRYGWFGRSDSCLLPSAEARNRFIDLEEMDNAGQ